MGEGRIFFAIDDILKIFGAVFFYYCMKNVSQFYKTLKNLKRSRIRRTRNPLG